MQHGKEEWREIADFPGYWVSTNGRVRSPNKVLKLDSGHRGHLRATLCRNGKVKKKLAHRLVLEAFVGLCPPGQECCHRDCNPANNHLSNLRWDTKSGNVADSRKLGRLVGNRLRGEQREGARLLDMQVKSIREAPRFKGVVQMLARIYEVSPHTIRRARYRQTWRHI